uniref:Uncharacterized protein n=1 Tax=Anguilla anguilla TaxID=7936 RepID=A0A0E9U9J8_ANGAN
MESVGSRPAVCKSNTTSFIPLPPLSHMSNLLSLAKIPTECTEMLAPIIKTEERLYNLSFIFI